MTAIKAFLQKNFGLIPVPKTAFCLSDAGESDLLRHPWPEVSIGSTEVNGSNARSDWDLNNPPGKIKADLVMACNTFMCARDPARWLRNIAMAAPYLLVQDLCRARRNGHLQCSQETHDVARYSFSAQGMIGETDPDLQLFDFSTSGHEVLAVDFYGGNCVKFVALLRLAQNPSPQP